MPSREKVWNKKGHAVMAVGYNRTEKCFIVRNSHGEKWGTGGHFKMPFDYFTDIDDQASDEHHHHDAYASSIWTLHVIST
jgi:C1A family cysteine protease